MSKKPYWKIQYTVKKAVQFLICQYLLRSFFV